MVQAYTIPRYHNPTVEFTQGAVQEYLDTRIFHWRDVRANAEIHSALWTTAIMYLDAYQAMRTALFGRPLGHE